MYGLLEYEAPRKGKKFLKIFFIVLLSFLVIFFLTVFFMDKYKKENIVRVQEVANSNVELSNTDISIETANSSQNTSSTNNNSDTLENNNPNMSESMTEQNINSNTSENTSDENKDSDISTNTSEEINTSNTSNDVVSEGTPVDVPSSNETSTLSEEQYNNIIHIYKNSEQKTVYLTFDDGPSKNITPLILDLLDKENIKATFFLLGTNVESNPEIVKREYSGGHYIANHGYSHKYSEIYANTDTILNDYLLCEQAIKNALNNQNFSTNVYRFPGGSSGGKYNDIKLAGKEVLKQNNIAYLDWNALTYDAEGTPTHESILENLRKTVGNKETVVLLMHDSSSKILTYETLSEVISFFKENGYTFKTLYDTLSR